MDDAANTYLNLNLDLDLTKNAFHNTINQMFVLI